MIRLLSKKYSDGPVVVIRLKPRELEYERSILITICSGIRRHLHFKEKECYKLILNLTFDEFRENGWVGPNCKKPWHEVPKAFGIRIIYSKKVPA